MEIRENEEFSRYITKAEKQGNYNAYGWFLRYMQIVEDLETLKEKHDKMLPRINVAVEEVKEAENETK